MELQNFDIVGVDGQTEEWIIVGTGPVDFFTIQLGLDAATQQIVKGARLTLIRKAPKPDVEPGFYPERSIMS